MNLNLFQYYFDNSGKLLKDRNGRQFNLFFPPFIINFPKDHFFMITTYLGFRRGTRRFPDFKVSQMIFRRPPVSWLSPVIVKETANTFVVLSFCHFEKDVRIQAPGLLTSDVCVGVETTPKYGDFSKSETHKHNNKMADNFRLSTVELLNQVNFSSQLCRLVLRGER